MKKRMICLTVSLSLILAGTLGRIAYISISKNYAVSDTYNSYAVNLETLYPTIYYSGGEKLTNNSEKFVAVLRPNERTVSDLHNLFSSDDVHNISNELKEGYPLVKSVDKSKKDNAKYIDVYSVNSSVYPAKQLISASSSGMLKYVKPIGEKKISFHIDALGRMLRGDEGRIYTEHISSERGIVISLNKSVEDIALEGAKLLDSGCVIVMDVKTSSILACITKPDDIYINKAFEQYCVGSIFKIIVAACALENGIDFYYTCKGKTTVGDTVYSCQNNKSHSFEDLKSALANSCNCYFVNLALKLGSDKITETARKLGFYDDIKLYKEWSIKAARMPDESALKSKGELALLGFGQGKLTSSPLQMCCALCTIANGGMKNQLRFVLSSVDDKGIYNSYVYKNEERALISSTSNQLIQYLRYVVTNGTGKSAEDVRKKAAGKTATAQTGRYILDKEYLNTWFAGVYPYDNPKYAIIVLCEDGKSGSEDCAPIYRYIVEKLNNL